MYLAVDDRLASLKTDTFSKTREEKMEDLFAQKEVVDYFCMTRLWAVKCVMSLRFSVISGYRTLMVLLLTDGRGRVSKLD